MQSSIQKDRASIGFDRYFKRQLRRILLNLTKSIICFGSAGNGASSSACLIPLERNSGIVMIISSHTVSCVSFQTHTRKQRQRRPHRFGNSLPASSWFRATSDSQRAALAELCTKTNLYELAKERGDSTSRDIDKEHGR